MVLATAAVAVSVSACAEKCTLIKLCTFYFKIKFEVDAFEHLDMAMPIYRCDVCLCLVPMRRQTNGIDDVFLYCI